LFAEFQKKVKINGRVAQLITSVWGVGGVSAHQAFVPLCGGAVAVLWWWFLHTKK
jgi:hypothetical protein